MGAAMTRNPAALQIGPWLKNGALRSLLVIAIVLVLKAASDLLIPIAVALVLTFVLTTPVRTLRRYGVPEALGAAVVVATLLSCTVLMGVALSGPAAQWWERAPSTMAQLPRSSIDSAPRCHSSAPRSRHCRRRGARARRPSATQRTRPTR